MTLLGGFLGRYQGGRLRLELKSDLGLEKDGDHWCRLIYSFYLNGTSSCTNFILERFFNGL